MRARTERNILLSAIMFQLHTTFISLMGIRLYINRVGSQLARGSGGTREVEKIGGSCYLSKRAECNLMRV